MATDDPTSAERALATRVLHAHADPLAHHGAVASPIYQSATFLSNPSKATTDYESIRYGRLSNTPNHETLHARIADIESGEAAWSCSSGMSAITLTLMSQLEAGDHLIASADLYGATHKLLHTQLPKLGVSVTTFDPRGDALDASLSLACTPRTKLIYLESMSNPLLHVPDFDAITTWARRHGVLSVIDNTFCSPINFRPLAHHFDLCLHSATKYLNGHSDVIAGCVSGSTKLIAKIRQLSGLYGASLDPHAAVLLERGMKTLALRVERQNSNALHVARWLDEERARGGAVSEVYYAGLERSPSYARASSAFDGYGGVLSFKLSEGATTDDALRVVSALKLAHYAPSLGGVETLATIPSLTSHSTLSQEERASRGIDDGLIRLAIGVERVEDILADLSAGLEHATL